MSTWPTPYTTDHWDSTWNVSDGNVTEAPAGVPVNVAAREYWFYWVGVYMHNYYLPIITAIGAVGNLLSFIVMIQPHNRRVSCCIYMAVLAISDLLNLYVAGHYWLATGGASPYVTRGIYYVECQALAYMFQTFQFNGVLLILFMTLDRFIAIRFPLKAALMCTPRRAKITSVCIVIFSASVELPYYFLSSPTAKYVCAALSSSKSTFTVAYAWINTCLNSFIPFILLLSMNGVIIRVIRKRSKYFQKMERQSTKKDGKSQKDKAQEERDRAARRTERQLTIMLLLVTFTFLALSLPQYIRYTTYTFVVFTTSPKAYATYIMAAHVSNKLYFTNNAVNFFLYCCGGSKFREDLKKIFVCGKQEKKTASSVSQSGDTKDSRI